MLILLEPGIHLLVSHQQPVCHTRMLPARLLASGNYCPRWLPSSGGSCRISFVFSVLRFDLQLDWSGFNSFRFSLGSLISTVAFCNTNERLTQVCLSYCKQLDCLPIPVENLLQYNTLRDLIDLPFNHCILYRNFWFETTTYNLHSFLSLIQDGSSSKTYEI